MIILSKEQVLKLHVSLIKATRGSDGILVLASGDIGEKEVLQWIIEHQQ